MEFHDARALAEAGMSVIPVSRTKRPLVKWAPFQSRIASRQQLRAWWDRFANPDAAVVTGVISGVVVIDCDDARALQRVRDRGVPDTLTVQTARGAHLYFEHPGVPVRNSAGSIAPGVDVRGDGGYVVAPGSRHASGSLYTIVRDSPPAPLPAWLLAEVCDEPRRPQSQVRDAGADRRNVPG